MTHNYEWKIKCVGNTIFGYVGKEGNYGATMSQDEIERRINAAEELPPNMAKRLAHWLERNTDWERTLKALRAYAEALEE